MDEERWLKKRAENLELLKIHKRDLDRQYVFTYLNLSWMVIFGTFFLMGDGFIWGTWGPPGVMETIFMLFSWPAIAGAGFAIGGWAQLITF